MLMINACPIATCAASDNPKNSTIDAFPALGVSLDTMDENNGTINTLYDGGTIKDNRGTISSSQGTVLENHGLIESRRAGHVGTNCGTINRIENTGSLGVNDGDGTILFVGQGNEVSRNDGTIQENAGKVSDNFGTVSGNYGTVIMHDGQIVNNYQNGTVTFEAKISGGETIPARGTVDNNTGNIEISNATVTVNSNSGSITVGKNATLICVENKGGGVITKTDESASITCESNFGHIIDETVAWYKIVFVGDDGTAEIEECDLEKDGVYYTYDRGNVIFSLPSEYECRSAQKLASGEWWLSAEPEEGDTVFTIVCQKISLCDSQGHSYGEWVIVKEPTLTETGTKERTCSVCKAKETEEIPVLVPAEYSIISGANSEWAKGSTDGLEFSSNAPFDKFDSVKIDGVTIDASNYTVESGSTRIAIFPTYLETLGNGRHSIEIVSVDGTASAKFSVTATRPTDPTDPADPIDPADPTNPKTGDNNNTFLWIALLFISSGSLAGTAVAVKKRRKAE